MLTRRNLLVTASSASLFGAPPLEKADFPVVKSETCLNNARWHPLSAGSRKAERWRIQPRLLRRNAQDCEDAFRRVDPL